MIATIDIVIIVVYLALTLALGIWFGRKNRDSAEGYFLAGRNLGWIAIGFSLLATNLSSEHFVGLAGAGATHGLVVGHFEWMAVFYLMLLGWFFAPLYLRSGVYTLPEYLENRFNRRVRLVVTSISIFAYIVTKLAITLLAGGMLLQQIFGLDIYTSSIILVALTGIYTIAGGLQAVVFTSVFQAVLLLLAAIVLTILGLNEAGGWQVLTASLPADYFRLFRPMDHPDFPWTGILFGAPILGIWYWCTDQYMVQRILGARNLTQARQGAILAGFLKILPGFVMVLPGMVAVVLFPQTSGDNSLATLLLSSIVPAGLKGFIISGFLAAMMSSLAASFSSTATLFTMDIYRHYYPQASQRNLVLVGRLSTTAMVATALMWVPLTRLVNSNMYLFLQSVQAYLSPPVVAVFLLGMFWKRICPKAAEWTLMLGLGLGISRLVAELAMSAGWAVSPWLAAIVEINFLHFALLLFLFSLLVASAISAFTGFVLPRENIQLTLPGLWAALPAGSGKRYLARHRTNLAFSILLIGFVGSLLGWLY